MFKLYEFHGDEIEDLEENLYNKDFSNSFFNPSDINSDEDSDENKKNERRNDLIEVIKEKNELTDSFESTESDYS